jgi:hypothetical protein
VHSALGNIQFNFVFPDGLPAFQFKRLYLHGACLSRISMRACRVSVAEL